MKNEENIQFYNLTTGSKLLILGKCDSRHLSRLYYDKYIDGWGKDKWVKHFPENFNYILLLFLFKIVRFNHN